MQKNQKTFEELVEMRNVLVIVENNLKMSEGMPFYGQYFGEYLSVESSFLNMAKEYYGNNDLTLQEIHERYDHEYEEYKPEMQIAR